MCGSFINNFTQDKTKGKFIRFIKELGYAIGRKNFTERYTESRMSYDNLSESIEIFGSDIRKIIDIGSQDNISENDMVHMTNLWGELMLKLAN